MFIRTTAINKMLAMRTFVKGVQGGTSAGKTFGILPIEIDYSVKHPYTETSVVAESVPHLKRGAIRDFKKIMRLTGRWNPKSWHETDKIYTFSNGSTIEFFSADDESKLRGARRDRLYINECDNITFDSYNQLASRTRKSIFLDWNPTRAFWFHEHLMGGKDVSFELLTYLDNEGAPPKAIEYILQAKEKAKTSKYWANWYRVYGLGQVGSLEGVIFENWEMIDAIPKEASLLCYGLDFGFNDPTAVIAMWRYNNEYYFDEVLYRSKILNGELAEVLKRYPRANIYADSAEPKSIKQLNQDGLRVYKTIKGKDSINYGIRSLQDVNFKVTKRSLNLIKELRNYIWATDRAGESTGKPIDNYNHAIDAMRYAFTMVARRKRNITKIRV